MGLALAALGALAACVSDGDNITSARVVNDLTDRVVIWLVRDGSEEEVGRVSPGDALSLELGRRELLDRDRGEYCTVDDLVARTGDGAEVARVPPPVCQADRVLLSMYPSD